MDNTAGKSSVNGSRRIRRVLPPLVISCALGPLAGPYTAVAQQPAGEPKAPPGDTADKPPDNTPIKVAPIDVDAKRRGDGSLTGDDPESADARRGLDDPTFVTVVRSEEHAGETTSVGEVLSKSLGVYMRTLGGLGSFTSISVRGADSGQTTVLIDGVPLSRVASVSADLGRFALDSFAELELYRSGVPVELGGAAIGGALNMVTSVGRPRNGRRLTLSTGGGSFGARHLRGRWRDGSATGKNGYHVSLGYSGATGDFTYYNDKGTNLDQGDDEYTPRQNNGYDQVDAVARWRGRRGDLTYEAGSRTMWKVQGLPGGATFQSTEASLATVGLLVDTRLAKKQLWGSSRLSGSLSLFGSVERQHYDDLLGEVGLGQQNRKYNSWSAGNTARVSVDIGDSQLLVAGLETRVDAFQETDLLATDPEDAVDGNGWRLGTAATVTDEIAFGEFETLVLVPGLRVDWQRTVPTHDPYLPGSEDEPGEIRMDTQLSPRLAYRVRVKPGFVIKGSGGRYFRTPTVVELFGDRGYIVGNPELLPETGISGDLGLVLAPSRALGPGGLFDRLYLESALFARHSQDTIAFITGAGLASRAQNLGDSLSIGVETGGAVRIGRTLTLTGNYTWLDTTQDSPLPSYDGKPLPQRPAHQLYGRLDAARMIRGRQASIWVDAHLTSGNFLDGAGLAEVPRRRFFGAGLKAEAVPGLLLAVEVKNLADKRIETIPLDPPPRPDLANIPKAVADFSGYPLPGRAFYFTVEWSH